MGIFLPGLAFRRCALERNLEATLLLEEKLMGGQAGEACREVSYAAVFINRETGKSKGSGRTMPSAG